MVVAFSVLNTCASDSANTARQGGLKRFLQVINHLLGESPFLSPSRAVVACQAHNLKVVGSTPTLATISRE